ncbi:hypothetical protein DITRI_Ditri06bG0040300 [Diplodiscus trichospermus]
MSQTGKLMPNLDQQSTKMLNLTVLQRIDPFIEEILITAAHVTFYEFNIDSNQWSRKDVEGSLFVVKRNTQPRFQFIVMNRRNTDNLVENLLGDFEYEVQVPYLLYRNAAQEVNGIWFYNPRECEDVANLFSRILNAFSKVPAKPKVSSSKSEFEELEAVPSMSVIEGPLEPAATASPATVAPEDSSFVNFFSAAMNLGTNAPNGAKPVQHYPLSSHAPSAISTPVPAPAPAPSVSSLPLSAPPSLDPISSSNRVTNLVKPSSFFAPPSSSSSSLMMPPPSSSTPTASALHPPLNVQRPYGTPMLQPFPPPTPPASLTPGAPPTLHNGSLISKDKVRDALLMLVQDDQFIDMFYQALQKSVSSTLLVNGGQDFSNKQYNTRELEPGFFLECFAFASLCLVFTVDMAALRRLITRNPNHSSLIPPTLLTCRRGIASKLFVAGISFTTTEKGLLDAFSLYGQVMEAKIITDRVSDKSKGFGFVTYASEDEAEKAIAEMNGKALNGRVIFVDYAKASTRLGGGMPIARGPPDPVSKN